LKFLLLLAAALVVEHLFPVAAVVVDFVIKPQDQLPQARHIQLPLVQVELLEVTILAPVIKDQTLYLTQLQL
jgi:hypothetical protein